MSSINRRTRPISGTNSNLDIGTTLPYAALPYSKICPALLYSSLLYSILLYSALLYSTSTLPLLYFTQVPTGHTDLWASENATY